MTDNRQFSAEELRAQAEKLEAEQAKANRGRVTISPYDGSAWIHDGSVAMEGMTRGHREAADAEIQALRTIPEFAAYLAKIRGEA